jgi:hypothetical protein
MDSAALTDNIVVAANNRTNNHNKTGGGAAFHRSGFSLKQLFIEYP